MQSTTKGTEYDAYLVEIISNARRLESDKLSFEKLVEVGKLMLSKLDHPMNEKAKENFGWCVNQAMVSAIDAGN